MGKALSEGQRRYIDTAEFWKDQYTNLHKEKTALESQLTQLQLLVDHTSESTRKVPGEVHAGANTHSNGRFLKRKAQIFEGLDLESNEVTAQFSSITSEDIEATRCKEIESL
jgi:hypothetical protein